MEDSGISVDAPGSLKINAHVCSSECDLEKNGTKDGEQRLYF